MRGKDLRKNARVKCKVHRGTGHDGPVGEQRKRSTLSLTWKLDGVRGQRHDPTALPREKKTACLLMQ